MASFAVRRRQSARSRGVIRLLKELMTPKTVSLRTARKKDTVGGVFDLL